MCALPNRDAAWRSVDDTLLPRLKLLGLQIDRDYSLQRVDGQPHWSILVLLERNKLAVNLLLECNDAIGEYDVAIVIAIDGDPPKPLVEVSGGGFTAIGKGTQQIVQEAYRAIGMGDGLPPD